MDDSSTAAQQRSRCMKPEDALPHKAQKSTFSVRAGGVLHEAKHEDVLFCVCYCTSVFKPKKKKNQKKKRKKTREREEKRQPGGRAAAL